MRKRQATLSLAAAACLVTASCGSTPSADLRVTAPPVSALEACLGPVVLTADMDTQLEQERAWAGDRRRLVACAEKHGVLAGYVENIGDALD